MIHTYGVGASITSTPTGSVPRQSRVTTAKCPAWGPVVRLPGAANASVHMSYMGSR